MTTLYIMLPLTIMAAIVERPKRPKRPKVYRKRRENTVYWDR